MLSLFSSNCGYWLGSCLGFPGGTVIKTPPVNAGYARDKGSIPVIRKITWSRKWQPMLVFLTGKFHAQRSLAGYSLRGHKELDMTERLSTHTQAPIKQTCFLAVKIIYAYHRKLGKQESFKLIPYIQLYPTFFFFSYIACLMHFSKYFIILCKHHFQSSFLIVT